MRILCAVNSFKSTASSLHINLSLEKTLKLINRIDSVTSIAVSDGGDGFLDCFRDGSLSIKIDTIGPLMNMKVKAEYLINDNDAFIEIAEVCGIKYLKKEQLNPLKTTTYGLGKVINDAVKRGAKNIYIGLGGTASNDAGCGVAHSWNIRFIDNNQKEIFPDIKGILKTVKIDFSSFKLPENIKFYAVADVKNKLLGKYGSAKVFAAQKGATPSQILIIEKALKHLTALIKKEKNIDISKIESGAAAGGLAAGIYGFFNGEIINGSDFIIKKLDIEKKIKNSDIVITGEGKFDSTSFYGKITGEIIKTSLRYRKKVIVITAINEIKRKDITVINLSEKYRLSDLIRNPVPAIKKEIISVFC